MGLQRVLNRSLNQATERVSQALLRLGTGNRLNSIADGGTEFLKFKELQSQARGLQSLASNVEGTQGLALKAQSSLDDMMSLAYDLRELADRARDEGLTDDERDALQDEADLLLQDFSTISAEAKYGTTKLLDGSFGTKYLQTGLQAGSGMNFGIGDARSSVLGRLAIYSGAQNGLTTAIDGTNSLRINGVLITPVTDDEVSVNSAGISSIAVAQAINNASSQTGVYAESVGTVMSFTFSYTGNTWTGTINSGEFVINNVNITGSGINTNDELITAINQQSSDTGVIATVDASGNIQLEASDGRNIYIVLSNGGTNNFYDAINMSQNYGVFSGISAFAASGLADLSTGAVRLWSSDQIIISAVTSAVAGFASGNYNLVGGTAVSQIDLSGSDEAEEALKVLDTTIAQISSLQANVGAVHDRLERKAISLIEEVTITDEAAQNLGGADFARETANLVYNQLLQNSSLASLIQANVSRVTVAKLLNDLE